MKTADVPTAELNSQEQPPAASVAAQEPPVAESRPVPSVNMNQMRVRHGAHPAHQADDWGKDRPRQSLRESLEQAKPAMAGQVSQDFEAGPAREFTVEFLQRRGGDAYDGGSSEHENEGTQLVDNDSMIHGSDDEDESEQQQIEPRAVVESAPIDSHQSGKLPDQVQSGATQENY